MLVRSAQRAVVTGARSGGNGPRIRGLGLASCIGMWRASILLFLAVALPCCSAVVSPSVGRLGGSDAGPTSASDAPGGSGCTAGLIDCGGRCVDPSRDPSACGGCGIACGAGASCLSGVCTCAPGAPGCGTLVPAIGDPADCGDAHARCATGQLCVLGRCECRPPLVSVGGACVDLTSDPTNCGMPGVRCPGVCSAGVCRTACPDGQTECDGACVDLRRNPLHCGDCGRACNGGQACVSGDCRDLSGAPRCTTCPCDACGGLRCCTLPRFDVPYCLEAGACP